MSKGKTENGTTRPAVSILVLAGLMGLACLMAGCGDSDDDNVAELVSIASNALLIQEADGGVSTHLFGQGRTPLTDPLPDGGTKPCFCQRLAFRATQALEKSESFCAQYPNGLPMGDFRIITRWNTDGAEELFVDALAWANEDVVIMADATDHNALALEDAVFYFVPKSGGTAWKVMAQASLFPADFFALRAAAKTGGQAEKEAFMPVKNEAMALLATVPIENGFMVEVVDPATEGLSNGTLARLRQDGGSHGVLNRFSAS